MRHSSMWLLAVVCAASMAAAAEPPAPAPAQQTTAHALGEQLIYSVDRVPERTFETARDVEVITNDEIARLNVQTLAQLLERQRGFGVVRGESGTMPVVRGLGGKQVMILIDGVKVNNATWRGASKDYLNMFDLSQIERVEIVRGVVSVLGTDSLGAVVNLVTKKGASASDGSVDGAVTARYATAERGYGTSLTAESATESFRFEAGLTYGRLGDVRGGGGAGIQPGTKDNLRGGHVNGQWLLSKDKTIALNYQNARSQDQTPSRATLLSGTFDPSQLSLLSASYQDLTSRGWEDSLKITIYTNYQQEIRDAFIAAGPAVRHSHEWDDDRLNGLNIELGTFAGAHQLVWGIDTTRERVGSGRTNTINDVVAPGRGNEMDGATYRTMSAYLQDRKDVGKWLTVIGGARLAQYQAAGDETSSTLGNIHLDTKRANVTGALNVIGHVAPHLNLIGNVIRGYRAPNIDDLSGSATKPGIFWIPNPNALPEKVLSVEAGMKYDGSRLQGSVFYFRNRFSDYIVLSPSTFDGLSFVDANGNRLRDPGESSVLQLLNVGRATIRGVDADGSLTLSGALSVFASYSRLIGTDQVANAPLTGMPPASGAAGIRLNLASPRAPWAEAEVQFAQAQTRLSATDIANVYIGPNGSPAYHVVNLRGGLTLSDRVALSLAVENLLDEKYRFIGSNRYQPGRQLVLGTQFRY